MRAGGRGGRDYALHRFKFIPFQMCFPAKMSLLSSSLSQQMEKEGQNSGRKIFTGSPESDVYQVHLYIVLPIDKSSITWSHLESAMHFSQAPRLAMRTITGYLAYGFYRCIFSLSLIYLCIFILPL